MIANTAIGEIDIHFNDRDYRLRPSFQAIQSIDDYNGAASQAGRAVSFCQSGVMPLVRDLMVCYIIVNACAVTELPDQLIGYFTGSKSNDAKTLYKQGAMEIRELCVLANHLMKWGLYGQPSAERVAYSQALARMRSQPQESKPIDILEFVSIASAPNGLGKSLSESWQMTMKEFQLLFDAQFPLTEKQRAMIPPPPEEEARLMAQIMAARERTKDLPAQTPKRLR